MPMTELERRFVDHAMIENHHFDQGSRSCLEQMGRLGLGHSDLYPFMVLREREWRAGYENPFPDFEQFLSAKVPSVPTPCPWADAKTFRARVQAVTLLSEENCFISRDFSLWHRCGCERYFNEPSKFENSSAITDWAEFLPTQGWKYRATFQPGVQRGEVAESLCRFPFSVWDPLNQPPIAVECHYLMLIKTPPEPIRIWGVTRSDILTYAGNGENYLTIFPTPFIP